MTFELRSCPFCGRPVSEDLSDTLYPRGSEWVERNDGCRSYHRHQEGQKLAEAKGLTWGRMWKLECNESEGGCGAEVSGHTRMEAIAAWNRRP